MGSESCLLDCKQSSHCEVDGKIHAQVPLKVVSNPQIKKLRSILLCFCFMELQMLKRPTQNKRLPNVQMLYTTSIYNSTLDKQRQKDHLSNPI